MAGFFFFFAGAQKKVQIGLLVGRLLACLRGIACSSCRDKLCRRESCSMVLQVFSASFLEHCCFSAYFSVRSCLTCLAFPPHVPAASIRKGQNAILQNVSHRTDSTHCRALSSGWPHHCAPAGARVTSSFSSLLFHVIGVFFFFFFFLPIFVSSSYRCW